MQVAFLRAPAQFLSTIRIDRPERSCFQQTYNSGIEITDELRAKYRQWGNPQTGEIINGKLSPGYLIRNCGDYYEVFSNETKGKFLKRIRYGYKIGNVIKGDVVYFRKAMPVGIGLSYKRNKE